MSAQTTVFTFPRIPHFGSSISFTFFILYFSSLFLSINFFSFYFSSYKHLMYTKKIPLWESIIYCFKMTLQTTHYELGFWYNKVIHKSFFLETDLLLGKLRWNTLKPSLDYFNFCIQFDVNKKCYYLEFLFEIGKFHPIGYHHILNLEFSKWGVNPKSSLLYQFLKII